MILFALLAAVPIIEIALLTSVGSLIGLWSTLGIVIATAAIGACMVKGQGRQAMANLHLSFQELRDPAEPLAHGAMILVAGALLVTPGFFTDAIGFALLVPPLRDAAYRHLRRRFGRITPNDLG